MKQSFNSDFEKVMQIIMNYDNVMSHCRHNRQNHVNVYIIHDIYKLGQTTKMKDLFLLAYL